MSKFYVVRISGISVWIGSAAELHEEFPMGLQGTLCDGFGGIEEAEAFYNEHK